MSFPGPDSGGIGRHGIGARRLHGPAEWVLGVVCVAAALVPLPAFSQRWPGDGRLLQPTMATLAMSDAEPGNPGAASADQSLGLRPGEPPQAGFARPGPAGQVGPADLPDQAGGLPFSRFFRLPEERFRGPGEPLVQESWQFRPYSVGGFFGFLQGGALVRDWTYEEQGMIGGLTLGWDFHHYFGGEMRLALGRVGVGDTTRAILAQQAVDDAAGLGSDDPARRRFDVGRDNDLFLWEVSVLYYPWGDSRWRPYATIGMGVTSVDFIDRLSTVYHGTSFTLPFGIGVKYLQSDCLDFRLECVDHMAIGGETPIGTTHRLFITAGVELRFGGSRRAYWPWNPGRHYW